MLIIFLIQYASSCFMTGVIWIMQIVHYPLFREVGKGVFKNYEASHTKLISYIVIPVMLLELVTGIYILFSDFLGGEGYLLYIIASILLLVIWLSTILIQARQHKNLSSGYDPRIINSLVRYNWIRTLGWTSRVLILSLILLSLIQN